MKNFINLLLIALLSAGLTLGVYKYFFEKQIVVQEQTEKDSFYVPTANNVTNTKLYAAENTDFTSAAQETVDAVVHVKNTAIKTYVDPWEQILYGTNRGRQYTQVGTGSGVIISPDGYIITNYHVVANATEIQITLNNKQEYKAKLIGGDEAIDIALVKIEADGLPYITFADSDQVKLGEWVLAVGNPYNLTSTVTAGIVSAKGRDLGNQNRIESYIQTDAAVNPGNSGGALVNTRGELVGINSAITSQTGSYIGYSFAVPSNIAKKVVEDLVEFGDVQRAYLGVKIIELNGENYKQLKADVSEGIYINSVVDNGAAKAAGLKNGDIIVKINGVKISKFSDLNGQLNAHRPGQTVDVTVLRNGNNLDIPVLLKNEFGNEIYNKTDYIDNVLGLDVSPLSTSDQKKWQINYGLKINSIKNRTFADNGIQKGDMILAVDKMKVNDVDDLEQYLKKSSSKDYVTIQILKSNGTVEYVPFKF